MRDADEKQMWWEAYLASLGGGMLSGNDAAAWDEITVRSRSVDHADAALAAYQKRWGLEKEPG